jgi:membrane protein implicated in regulation of membrane protease activity
MRTVLTTILAAALTVGVTLPAAAYIGPGAGLSLLGAFWGLLVAVMAALGFVILWPIRRLFRRDRTKQPAPATQAPSGAAGARARSL